MNPRSLSTFFRLGVCAATSLAAVSCEKKAPAAAPAAKPPTVLTAPVVKRDVPLIMDSMARTKAVAEVEIRARVPGFLTQAPFKEGSKVKKDDLLFIIDPQPFETAVAQAKANVEKAQAVAARSKADVARLTPLVARNAVSQQELDNTTTANQANDASVSEAKAALAKAELDLGYTTMRAPFDGIIGARKVDVGNFVGSGPDNTLLATISTTDPMQAVFTVPEQEFLRFQKRFIGNEAASKEQSDAMVFKLLLSDDTIYGQDGRLNFADRAIDDRAGTLKVVVDFPNTDGLLRPGQFVRVRSQPETLTGALLIPQRAVITTQSAQSVMVVGADHKTAQRPVKTGDRFQEFFIITEGLKEGELVIVDGLQKMVPGMTVNDQPLPAKETPKP